jgi:hypothetical protein
MVVLSRVRLRGAARRTYGRFLPGRQHRADLRCLAEQTLPQMPCSYRFSNRAKEVLFGKTPARAQRRHGARQASEVSGEW